jgi:hypothetical protein
MDVKPLLVFEGVVDLAMFVPIGPGDALHDLSTNVLHHIVE